MPFIHETPKCQRCGSIATGRYMVAYRPDTQARLMEKGELIKPCSQMPVNNIFCSECGLEWMGIVKIKYISREEMKTRKLLLGITKESIRETELDALNCIKEPKKKGGIIGFVRKASRWFIDTAIVNPISSVKKDISDILKNKNNNTQ